MKELQLGKLLRKANITRNCGVSTYEIFQFLLLLVFQRKNLFRFLNSKHKDHSVHTFKRCTFMIMTGFMTPIKYHFPWKSISHQSYL